MSDFSNRLTAYGLTSIDIATAMVLNKFAEEDYEGSISMMRVLVSTTGDDRLITLYKEHQTETDNQLKLLHSNTTHSVQEKLTPMRQRNTYMEERANDLYEKIRIQMKNTGMITQKGQANNDTFDKLEGEDSEDGRSEL